MDDLELIGRPHTGESVYIKIRDDGTLYMQSGNGCENGSATITREQAIELENWLTEHLTDGAT